MYGVKNGLGATKNMQLLLARSFRFTAPHLLLFLHEMRFFRLLHRVGYFKVVVFGN